jgi:hypothetical protein
MAKTRKLDTLTIRDLVALLELECSALVCMHLAYALGYRVFVWENFAKTDRHIVLERSGTRVHHSSLPALRKALLRDARCRLVGH